MIVAAPHFQLNSVHNHEFEYWLLGDLREILEDPAGPQTSRWLLAVLDMILVGRPQVRSAVYLPVQPQPEACLPRFLKSPSIIDKLRRLRDRVAHRSNYSALANEIRGELRDVMCDRINSAACLFDA